MPINVPSPWLGGIGDALYTLGQSITQQQAQKQALALQQQQMAQKANEFNQTNQLEWAKLAQQGQIAGLSKLLADRQRQDTFDENAAGKAPVTFGSPSDPNYSATPLDPATKAIVQNSTYAPQLKDVQAPMPFMSAFGAPGLGAPTTLGTILTPNQAQQQAYDTKQASQDSAKTLKDQREAEQKQKDLEAQAMQAAKQAAQDYEAGNPNADPEKEMKSVQAALSKFNVILPNNWIEGALPALDRAYKMKEAVAQHAAEQPPNPFSNINWNLGGENPEVTEFKKSLQPGQQQFLNQFQPQEQQIISQIASYKYPFPSGMGGMSAFLNPKNPYSKYWDAAQKLNPALTAQDYGSINNFVTKFNDPNGLTGQQIKAANTLMEHMAVQVNNIAALHNKGGRPINAARNLGQTFLEGGAAPGNYAETNGILSEEANKLWVGAAGSNESRQLISAIASPNASATQQYNALLQLYKLMQGQIATIEDGYRRVTHRDPASILGPAAQAASSMLALNLSALSRNPDLAYGSK